MTLELIFALWVIVSMSIFGYIAYWMARIWERQKGIATTLLGVVDAINKMPDIEKVTPDLTMLTMPEFMEAPPGTPSLVSIKENEWREWDDTDTADAIKHH